MNTPVGFCFSGAHGFTDYRSMLSWIYQPQPLSTGGASLWAVMGVQAVKRRGPAFGFALFWIVLCSFLLTGARCGAATVPAEEVLRLALEARGGDEAFSKIRSFSAKGAVRFYTGAGPWADAPLVTNVWPLEVFATRSNQFRYVTDLSSTAGASSVYIPFRYYPNGCDGQNAWEAVPGRSPQTLPGIFGAERREQAQLFAWCAEARNYAWITNRGEVTFEGRPCYELKLVGKSGNQETHYYDVKNHLLAGMVRSSVFGPTLERFIFEKYEAYGGFLFPTRIRYLGVDARPIWAVEELECVQLNPVTQGDFARPGESPWLGEPASAAREKQRAEDARNLLYEWVETDKLGEGVAVGWLDEAGRWVAFAGRCSPWHDSLGQWGTALAMGLHLARAPRVDEGTAFPLASISKVFTRLLLLDMVQRGEMRLEDPVELYLPELAQTPGGKRITLLHLATHTAGLPRYIPGSERQVYAWLRGWKPSREPGERFEYSNTGMGLLGKAIERKAGKSYRKLVQERICQPLGLRDTHVMRCTFPGIDGVISTADDLLTFASGCLGLKPVPQPLGALMQHEFATHPGGSERFDLELIIDPAHRRALVSLWSKMRGPYSQVPQSTKRLMLDQPFRPAAVADINWSACEEYVGQYLMEDNSVWSVRRSGQRLLLQKVCRESYEIFPTSQTGFTNRLVALGAAFRAEPPGQPMHLALYKAAGLTRGSKISAHPPLRGSGFRLDSKSVDACAGQYADSENRLVVVRRAGKRLVVADPTGLGEQELVAESETNFVCPATAMGGWTFVQDQKGEMTGLIRHHLNSHARYSRVSGAAPSISTADKDKFLGTWETRIVTDQGIQAPTKKAIVTIFKAEASYCATIRLVDSASWVHRFKTVHFITASGLLLKTSVDGTEASLMTTLNNGATEMSGTWKLGTRSLPVTLKRVTCTGRKVDS